MNMQEIEINITEEGKVELHVKGIKGPTCEDLTRDLEEALGEVEERTYTSEYYEESAIQIQSQVQQKSKQ
ncbi:MAG: DUF2997 domain-containing protein [Candidatus Eremiobacteraeota bacterium]|nr:DUF2997 domain-containing protein [Candidatus Eremiobacteraeota bacterium]